MNYPLRLVLFLSFLVFPTLGTSAQAYWDEIELIDGQVLRGVVVDTVKDTKVIQLTTRDFISLPAASVVRTVTAQQRRKEAEAKLSLPAVKIDLSLAVVAPNSPGWKSSWGTVRYQATQALGIELEDGQVFEGNWLDTVRGQAVVLAADGRVLALDRASIRRVTAAPPAEPAAPTAPAPALAVAPVAPAEPQEPEPDILTPFFAGIARPLEAAFAGPPGADPTPFQTFFVPTARLTGQGQVHLNQLDGAATQVSLGITDYLQGQASAVLPTLASHDLPSFWRAGAQVSLPLSLGGSDGVSTWLSLGQWAGGLRINGSWSDASFLPFVNATARSEGSPGAVEGSVLAGYLVRPKPQSGLAVLGASVRVDLAPGLAILTEMVSSLSLEDRVDRQTSAVAGVRLWHGNFALDLGVQGVLLSVWKDEATPTGWGYGWTPSKVNKDTTQILPVVNLSFRF